MCLGAALLLGSPAAHAEAAGSLCAVDDDCGPGGACVWGACVLGLGADCPDGTAGDEACGEGLVCVAGLCEWSAGTCVGDHQCDTGERCDVREELTAGGRGWCVVDTEATSESEPVPPCGTVCSAVVPCAPTGAFGPGIAGEEAYALCEALCAHLQNHPELKYSLAGLSGCVAARSGTGCHGLSAGCAQAADRLARDTDPVLLTVSAPMEDCAAVPCVSTRETMGDLWRRVFGLQGTCPWGTTQCDTLPVVCPDVDKPDGCFARVASGPGNGPAARLGAGLVLLLAVGLGLARRRGAYLVLVAVLSLSAFPAAAHADCASDSDCEEGQRCVLGSCHAAVDAVCAEDGDCGPGLVCVGCHCGEIVGTCLADGDCGPGLRCLWRADGLPGDSAAESCTGGGAARGWCVVDGDTSGDDDGLVRACEPFCDAMVPCDEHAPTSDRETARYRGCMRHCLFLGRYPPTAAALTNLRNCVSVWGTHGCGRLRSNCARWADALAAASDDVLVGLRYDDAPVRMPLTELLRESYGIEDGCVVGEGECVGDPRARCPSDYVDTGCGAGAGHGASATTGLLLLLAALVVLRRRRERTARP